MPSWFPPIDGQEERELGAGAHRELAVDAGEMGLDCLRAHAELLCSLPVRPAHDGSLRCKTCFLCSDACRYAAQLRNTADRVAGLVGLGPSAYRVGWQSAGRTGEASLLSCRRMPA